MKKYYQNNSNKNADYIVKDSQILRDTALSQDYTQIRTTPILTLTALAFGHAVAISLNHADNDNPEHLLKYSHPIYGTIQTQKTRREYNFLTVRAVKTFMYLCSLPYTQEYDVQLDSYRYFSYINVQEFAKTFGLSREAASKRLRMDLPELCRLMLTFTPSRTYHRKYARFGQTLSNFHLIDSTYKEKNGIKKFRWSDEMVKVFKNQAVTHLAWLSNNLFSYRCKNSTHAALALLADYYFNVLNDINYYHPKQYSHVTLGSLLDFLGIGISYQLEEADQVVKSDHPYRENYEKNFIPALKTLMSDYGENSYDFILAPKNGQPPVNLYRVLKGMSPKPKPSVWRDDETLLYFFNRKALRRIHSDSDFIDLQTKYERFIDASDVKECRLSGR